MPLKVPNALLVEISLISSSAVFKRFFKALTVSTEAEIFPVSKSPSLILKK